ncbi:hypothetical protein DRQ50_00120 [bacterium]|nr:MAG: hypothetical protein DRQ50_00120 [bacterium]
MSWIRGSATDFIDLSDELVAAATGDSVATVAVSSGGTGYTEGDVLLVAGGTNTIAAQVEVTSETGGVIDGVRIYNAGAYTATPTTPNSATGGTGSGASITLTFTGGNGWTANRNAIYSGSDKEVMLEGDGGGSDAIHVGWRTFRDVPAGYYNWELHGTTGYTAGADMKDQPSISPGFFDGASNDDQAGAYLLLHEASVDFWFSITSYRIIGVVKVGTAYFNFFLGWADRFATSTEYPYPLVVAGHTSAPDDLSNQGKMSSGLLDPWRDNGANGLAAGPMFVYFTDGGWHSVHNGLVSSSARQTKRDRVVIPCGHPQGQSDCAPEDLILNNMLDFDEFIPIAGLSNTPTANIHPTPGTADGYVMLPCTIVFSDPTNQVVANLPDIFWISGYGAVGSEDRNIVGGEVYRIFQNCNRTDNYAFFALKEV